MSLILPFSIFNNIDFTTDILSVSGTINDIIFSSPDQCILVGSVSSVNNQSVSSIAFFNNSFSLDTSFLQVSATIDETNPLLGIVQKSNNDLITVRYNLNDTTNNIYNINTTSKSISSMTNPVVGSPVIAIEIGENDKLIVGGGFLQVDSTTRNGLACLSGTGTALSLDNNFKGGVRTDALNAGSIYVIKTDNTFEFSTPGDTIIVAGSFKQVNSTSPTTWVNKNTIARLFKSTGYFGAGLLTFNPSFINASPIIYDFDINDIDPSYLDPFYGNILIAGFFTGTSGKSHLELLNSDGSSNSFFTHNIPSIIYAYRCIFLKTGSNTGKIAVVVVDTLSAFRLYILNSNGTIDLSYNKPNGYYINGNVNSLIEDRTNGNIIVGGKFNSIEGKARNNIAVIDIYGNIL